MASKRPGPLQLLKRYPYQKVKSLSQWPLSGQVRCNPVEWSQLDDLILVSMASKRPGPLQLPAHIVLLYKHKIDLFA